GLSILTLTKLISSLHTFEQKLASRDDEDSIENTSQSKLNIKSQNLNKREGKKGQENSESSDTLRKIENKTEDRK
ncbi:hypothetical protein HN51_012082, partial [Arachis hypogaea]